MGLKSRVSRCVRLTVVGAAVAGLFASGPAVFASGQASSPVQTPQPAAAQVGAATTTLRLGSDEAVRMALENNLGIQTERLNPQLQALAVSQALAVYTPELFGTTLRNANTAPPTDFLSQGVAVTTDGTVSGNGGLRQNVKWFGGGYSIGMAGSRYTTDAPRSPFSPRLGSSLSFGYTQPLLRGLKIDAFRQNILQSKKQLEIADVLLAQRITQTSRTVRNAYFNLIAAISSLDVAQQSLELAKTSLKNSERKVEVGTSAPIDIVDAQAEVARNEETVIVRQGQIEAAQDALRALVMNPSQADFWTTRIEPAEQPSLTPRPVDADAAIRNALANRTDLIQLKKQIESVDLTIRYNQNLKLPAINLSGGYGVQGVGGTLNQYGPDPEDGSLPPIVNTSQRNFGDVLRDVFANDFRNWNLSINVSYPLGGGQADAALASSRLQRQQALVSQRQLEIAITTQVREAVRDVSTTLQRVEATRRAREFSERRLEAENKRIAVGLSDTFRLFQAQRDLTQAKQVELNAIIDYNRALIDLEAVQTVPLAGGF